MSDSNMLLERAKSALIAHDYTQAARIYKNLILENPDNLDYKMQLGNLYTKAGKDEQALVIFQQIQRSDNENFDSLIAISGIYRRQKKYDESVAILEQALLTCANDSKSRAKISYNLGFTYRQMGNYDDAIHCFEEVVEENPSDVLANNHLGAIYALQGKHYQAIEAYNRGLKFDANHPILQFNIAKSYAEIGERQKALSFYEGALRAKPGWTEAIEAYADLLLDENKINEANEVVNQALKINPDDVKMHTAKGNVYNRQSIFEDAETEFKKALDVDEGYKNALTGLAHSLENQGKISEAVETISKAENLHPNDLKIMKQSAHIYISANKMELAYDKIKKLQEIDKNDIQTMNLLGQYYICNDNSEKAEECFASIKRIDPSYNEIYRDWGERFVQKGNDEKAESYFQTAIQKNPNDSIAMVQLGELYESQKQLEKALKFYKKASNADMYNYRSKIATERISSDESMAAKILQNQSFDSDSSLSDEKIVSDSNENFDSENLGVESEIDISPSEALEVSEDSSIVSVAQISPEKDSVASNEDFNSKFNMEKLVEPENENIDSVADLLEKTQTTFADDNALGFDNLIEGNPFDSTSALESEPEVENSEFEHEISEDSLDRLEEQIKRATELAEKANYAAESALQAANQAADVAQALEEAKRIPLEAENDEDDSLSDNDEENLLDSDLLSAEEKLAEDEVLDDNELDSEDELLNDDIMENEMEDAELEKETPKINDVTLRRAIDMLPSIIAAIEDRSVVYRFRSYLSMFKALREMLEYLPEEQQHEFMVSRNRLILDYVISKLSGRPGLYATTKALLRSGLIHGNPQNKASEKEGIELVKEVLVDLRKLNKNIQDKTLREVLDNEVSTLEKSI